MHYWQHQPSKPGEVERLNKNIELLGLEEFQMAQIERSYILHNVL